MGGAFFRRGEGSTEKSVYGRERGEGLAVRHREGVLRGKGKNESRRGRGRGKFMTGLLELFAANVNYEKRATDKGIRANSMARHGGYSYGGSGSEAGTDSSMVRTMKRGGETFLKKKESKLGAVLENKKREKKKKKKKKKKEKKRPTKKKRKGIEKTREKKKKYPQENPVSGKRKGLTFAEGSVLTG